MHRCLDLANLSAGDVAPNPMVGAVLVHGDRIIGEGFHQYYGGPHAEVNCLKSVRQQDLELIKDSVLYVSLEPCSHFGKTPPCADFIIDHKIPEVVVGCRDPFVEVNGKGLEKLKQAGVRVITGVLESECVELNKRFFTFHNQHRPYIVLKWAQTRNGKIAGVANTSGNTSVNKPRLYISNEYSNRLVHRWRSEEASILVGTNTALMDDPSLTNRLWTGGSPLRLVVDLDLSLPSSLKIFNDQEAYTLVFNTRQHQVDQEEFQQQKGIGFYQVTPDVSLVQQITHALYQMKIQSVLVEGGARLIQSFIDEEMWDEARVITNRQLHVEHGLPGPVLSHNHLLRADVIMSDQIQYFAHQANIKEGNS